VIHRPTSGQLAFDLPAQEAFRRADFYPSPANAEALAAIDSWPAWPQGKLLLIGPEGAGKTHLAHLWAEVSGARILQPADLQEDLLPDLAKTPLVLENAEAIAAGPHLQTALFHLHNLMAGQGLLITASSPPRDWGLTLADLQSRLQAIPVASLNAPDDALLAAVLLKLFADRQITVPPNLIPFLLLRMDRSIAAARALVSALDARALQEGRAVTRALAAEMLDSDPPE
jgi:chromosomal replication initiation ATPase DnaA